MLPQHIALVSLVKDISAADLAQTSAALQKQATRDLAPIWGVHATVDSFPDLNSIPAGYWPIVIMEKLNDPTVDGYHTDYNNQPLSVVKYDAGWQLSCSHEMIEMMVDPFGNRLLASDSIEKGKGRVQYLVEACDPCEDASFAYPVNGIMLSDFYTPHYFDPVTNLSERYSFTGSIKSPRQILKNGYLTWYDPTDKNWYQATFFTPKLKIDPLPGMKIPTVGMSLREQIDRLTTNPNQLASLKKTSKSKGVQLENTRNTSVHIGTRLTTDLKKYCQVK